MRAKACQPTADLNFPQTGVNDYPASVRVTCDHQIESSAIVAFPDQGYRYRLVTSQIRQNAGLEPVGNRIPVRYILDSDSASALRRKTSHTV